MDTETDQEADLVTSGWTIS